MIARNVHDADDLVQVSVEMALARAEQWRPGSKLDSWMFGIMKNAWIDEIRARRRRERVHAPEEAGLGVGDASAAARDIALSVQVAMARLPDEQHMALALVLVRQREIGSGVTRGYVEAAVRLVEGVTGPGGAAAWRICG